ncbi:ATP-binding cassette domain-containing protein [Haloarcula sp. CBA1130]|uniref:ABC transporter ATP-binding protein n=1 Tax=unclassified Haloarcula TaxID=2624677 RepID=UPI0012450CE1|nr:MULTISPECIES: ABC transporter ATP-binding protein [unclassified Haloarcula]KAA9396468.1 ATP-binding cassette domain-containing protein [Haloarcula sp. CBA1130]KAA9397676.1 ATP-binding cassette domain-containing protein [Haloarcula sp. CBA1129]
MTAIHNSQIAVAELQFKYPGTDEYVLDGANLTIEPGEFVAVVGGNGSGKTTLCKSFNGIIPHFYEGDMQGDVSVAGHDVAASSVAELSQHVGYVFQEFDNQLVSPTVFEEVAFAPMNYGHEDYRERVHRTLDLLDLDGLEDRFVWELSGGQKHLVALAAALSLDPDILVVDEPAAQLDPINARETYERLATLNQTHGKTIVTIEHQTEFIAEYCDSVVLVEDGVVSWKRPVEDALNQLTDLRAQDVHPPQVTRIAERVLDNSEQLPVTISDAATRFAERVIPDGGRLNGDSEPVPEGTPVISVEDVSHSYDTLRSGTKHVLDDLSLDVYPDERVVLVGSNGAGKSTLMQLLTGLEMPDSGTVTVDGTDTERVLPEELADEVVYVKQNPEEMFIDDSVRADVAHYLKDRDYTDVEQRVDDVIDFLDLEALEDRDGRLLSVGQQRRASLAIGLATNPSIVLLDEPTGSLDLASREEVGRTIDRAGERVETVVIATHDLELAASWATRVVVLDSGSIIADGHPNDVFADCDVLERANLRPPQTVRLGTELGLKQAPLTVEAFADYLHDDASATTGEIE